MALDELQRAERAQRIKELREESPYTQEALAERVGVTVRAYQAWEMGGGITWDHLEALAEIHGVDVQLIHRGEMRERPALPFATSPELGALAQLAEAIGQVQSGVERLEREVETLVRRLSGEEGTEARE